MTKLRVSKVTIRDVLGIREAGIEPGRITIFEGHNASNKTGHMEAIKTALGGGNLAHLARIPDGPDDEVKPEVVLVIEGDTPDQFWQVEKKGEKVRVRKRVGDTAGLEDVPKPQRWLSGLIDPKLMNPIEFLNAKDKDRVLLLLEALPVQFDRSKIWAKMGLNPKDFQAVPTGIHPLTELALIREAVFRERTGVNRDAKAKAESAEQTRRAVPVVIPEGIRERIEELASAVSERDTELARKMEVIKSECEAKAQSIRSEHQEYAARRRAEVEAQIAQHKEAAEKEISLLDDAKDTAMEGLFEEQKELQEQKRELVGLRNTQENNLRFQTLKEQADKFQVEAEQLQAKSAHLTVAIETLDLFRRGLLEDLPIEGLEVDDTTIRINGVPLDQTNTAEKIKLAVKVACLRAKKQPLPVLFIDGAEALDSANFELFCEELKAEGVWPFIGRVSDKPFEVRSK